MPRQLIILNAMPILPCVTTFCHEVGLSDHAAEMINHQLAVLLIGVDESEHDKIKEKFFHEGRIAHAQEHTHAPLDHLTCDECIEIARKAVENYANIPRR